MRLREWKGGITEEQKWELYIPSGVKAENELFNGFGRRELLQSIAGSLFGGAVAAVIWLCSNNVAFTVVAVLTGIFGSVMMCTKDQNNQSVVDQVGNMIRFARSQQILHSLGSPAYRAKLGENANFILMLVCA